MPSKRCIQGLVESQLKPSQYRGLNDTFDRVMWLTFEVARAEANKRAHVGPTTITARDVKTALRDLAIK